MLGAWARRWLGIRQLSHLVRFEPVLELILSAGPAGTVLDVGSGSEGITTLLPPSWQGTALDADFTDYAPAAGSPLLGPGQMLGDVRSMPFDDRIFDVVIAVDLLEHVPPLDRQRAVSEICRVSRRRAVIACPVGEAALAADQRLAERMSARGRPVPGWLAEHLDHGFPEIRTITDAASRFGTIRVVGNESVAAHERLSGAELTPITGLGSRLVSQPVQALMTSRRRRARRAAAVILKAIRGDDRTPTYRAVVAVDIAPAGAASAP
jgi:SAM-dependent methyltransferase